MQACPAKARENGGAPTGSNVSRCIFFMKKNTKATTRSLIQIGSTFYVSLPFEYAKRNKLKKGQRVGLVCDDIVVIVSPKEPK